MSTYYNKAFKKVSGPQDVPDGPHYAIIIFDQTSVTIPGDERSRMAPGHGYPEHTETYNTFEYYVTKDIEDWKEELATLHNLTGYYKKKFVGITCTGKAKMITEVKVE